MFPSSPSRTAALLAVLCLPAAPALAEARLEIAGVVESASEEQVEVRVDVTNRGPQAADEIKLAGSLFDREAEGRLEGTLAVGATRGVTLRFPAGDAVPGTHALALVLDYRSVVGGNATTFSQPAWVLLAFGGQGDAPVTIRLSDARLDVAGRLDVSLASADGAAHSVRVTVTTPRVLRAAPVDRVVDVPASGSVTLPVQLFRVDAPWGSRQGLLVVASDDSGPLRRTAVAAGSAQVGPDPARLPRLRRALVGIACLLLAAAVAIEVARRRAPAAA